MASHAQIRVNAKLIKKYSKDKIFYMGMLKNRKSLALPTIYRLALAVVLLALVLVGLNITNIAGIDYSSGLEDLGENQLFHLSKMQ